MALLGACGWKGFFRCCDCFSRKYVFCEQFANKKFSTLYGNGLISKQNKFKPSSASQICQKPAFSPNRLFSSGPADENKKPEKEAEMEDVRLIDVPIKRVPNLFFFINNYFFMKIVMPHLDKDFDVKEFLMGAQNALTFVSQRLASGSLNELEEVVSPQALQQIQKNYSRLNESQRQRLLVNKDDIMGCFIYNIGNILKDEWKKHFVEITVVYHCGRGYRKTIRDMQQNDSRPNLDQIRHDVMTCNYRFIKEFTKGVESAWTVSRINHFLTVVKS